MSTRRRFLVMVMAMAMSTGKLLALEWDGREARVVVATSRGGQVVVEEAFAIDIAAVATDDTIGDSQEVGRRIADALTQRGLMGCNSLVGLGRASIELRLMSLPPAPPEEIPDMVRFQALQAFTAIGEDWPLDFVELGAQKDAINVLAATLSPKQVDQILQVCAASELKPRCLVLRPFAAASLLNRSQVVAAGTNAVIVDMLADGADLTAVAQGQVVFMRTVRLPATSDQSAQARALLGEVRRTIGAVQAQESGRRFEQIIICGSATEHPLLAQSLSEALSLDVVLFDPFHVVQVTKQLQEHLPADSGRYAPLIGMLADEVAGVRHAIDFLNPRKRPTPPSNRRRSVMIAASVLGVAGVVACAVWAGLRHLDNQIAELKTQAAALDKEVDNARKLIVKADAVREFTDGDVTWLDEVREVARRIPDASRLKLDDMSFGADLKRGGALTLKGHVKSSNVIADFEDSLRYDGNIVAGRYGTIDRNQREYPYVLDTTVAVVPDVYDLGRSRGRPFREELKKQVAEPPKEPLKEQPAEPAKEQPKEPLKEQPAEPAKEQPKEPLKEQPAEPAKEQPKEPLKEQPKEQPAESPKEPLNEQPKEPLKEPPQGDAATPKEPTSEMSPAEGAKTETTGSKTS